MGCLRLTVRWMGCDTQAGMSAFQYTACAITPNLTMAYYIRTKNETPAAMAYLQMPDLYPKHIAAGYQDALIARRAQLMTDFCHADLVQAMVFYAEHGQITAENFASDYFDPAMKEQATGCVAWLLEWRYKHLAADDAGEWAIE
jgi:hypothetical protein